VPARLAAVCFDAVDPHRLARFWAAALGWTADGLRLVPAEPTSVPVVVRAVPHAKAAKNPIHLDLSSSSFDDQAATVARLVDLGAGPADVGQRGDESHVVLADPEGNELCVLEPGNGFVDAASRFGSVTCDGSPGVGRFWSAVLGWPLVWDQDDETAIRAPDGTGPLITWGPPVPADPASSRHHLVPAGADVDDLVALGATPLGDAGFTDPDGYEFWLEP
jgi:hypothetical protein